MKVQSWTTKRAERVWKKLRNGMCVKTLAAEEGCGVRNIHRRLKVAGYSADSARREESREELQTGKIYADRKAGKEFMEIAVELGMEPTKMNVRKVYMRLVRYCERAGVPYPHMPRKRKRSSPGRKTVPGPETDALIDKAVRILHARAEKNEQTDLLDLADALNRADRDTKSLVAEMRRRLILSDGVVPTPGAAVPESLTPSERAVLNAVQEAWDNPTQPCETLSSLKSRVPFAHSSINLALVKLRHYNLIEPRGFLYLRT